MTTQTILPLDALQLTAQSLSNGEPGWLKDSRLKGSGACR